MKRIKTYNGLIYNLTKEISRGRLLDSNRVERGIGKSCLLYWIAYNASYKIITKTKQQAKMFNKEFKTDIYYSIGELNELRGKRLNGLLLEEGLSLEDEKACKRLFDIIGGYSLNYKGGEQ